MKCYRCDSTLSNNHFCNSCGANVAVYKKVIKLSNAYYNMGLAKAQIRDLTGACELLRRSVRFNKKNTDARNLLGLVYFEMGEAVQAFSEWVISKNLQPEKNLADDYIKRLQSNAQRLDTINQTIKKYNLALGYAKQGNDDVAVIQLKKVLNNNQNLVKGHLLLGLLYMRKGEFEKAKKPIIKALRIDANNPLAKKYLKEIERELGQKLGAAYENTERETRKIFSGETDVAKTEKEYDVIVPRTRGYRESNAGLMSVINVIIGLVVGVAVSFFLLIPAKEKAMNSEHNKEVLQLHSQIDTLNTEKTVLESKIEQIEGEKAELSNQIAASGNANTEVLQDYDTLLNAVTCYQSADFINCATNLKAIKSTERSEAFRNTYNAIMPEAYKQAANNYYTQGKDAYNTANSIETWQVAIDNLRQVFNYNFIELNYVEVAELLGTAYEKQYDLVLAQSTETAGTYKEKALLSLAELVEQVFANTPDINPDAAAKAQESIVRITEK